MNTPWCLGVMGFFLVFVPIMKPLSINMDGNTGNLSLGVTNEPVILVGCFTPLIIIFIVMKLAVWIEAVNAEQDYVLEKNLYENEDPLWRTHMLTLMKKKRSMEIGQIIDDALEEYYTEKGLPVPNWKRQRDPQWWIDYLKDLDIDPDNP